MANNNNGKATSGGREPRCVALVGPFGSGKTSLLEAILARTDKVDRQGTVADGNTIGDGSAEARAHGMSVELNFADAEYLGDQFHFIDCPGSVEFLGEMDSALSGADLAVVVAEDDERKVPALQLILKALEARAIPRVLFLNKIDKSTRRVRDVLESAAAGLGRAAGAAGRSRSGKMAWQPASSIWRSSARMSITRKKNPAPQIDMSDEDLAREHEARFSMLELLGRSRRQISWRRCWKILRPSATSVFADLDQ